MNDQVEEAGRVAMRTGRVLGGLFCLMFVLVGLVAGAFILREAWLDLAPHFWERVECRILQSNTGERRGPGAPYAIAIRYEYRWENRSLVSDQIFRRPRTFADYREAQRLLDRYPVQARAICRVNPAKPEETVLEKRFPWMVLALIVPLMFVTVGAFGCRGAFYGPAPGEEQRVDLAPLSSRAGGTQLSARCLFAFFLVFFGVGTFVLHLLFIRPVLKSRAAQSWTEVSCQVLSSGVQRHQGQKTTTYSVDVLYEYQVDGRPYRSNRHSFAVGSSSGRSDKEAIVSLFPPGRKTVCYVDPADPTEAVLHRGMPGDLWMALIPAAFMGVGAGGMFFALRRRSRSNGAARSSRGRVGRIRPIEPIEPIDATGEASPLVMRSTSGRLGKFVGFLVFGCIWNGVVAAFLVPFARGTRQVSTDWFMAVFLIPFVLVGLVVFGLVIYHFLALFAPRASLTLARRDLRLGESVELTWAFAGRVRRIEKLRLYLEGREEATYRRGTSTATDRSVFAEVEITTTTDPVAIGGGRATLTVPTNAVPTLAGSNNKIVWTLRVKGVIRMYPDVDDTFEIPVRPRAMGGRG